MIKSGSQSTMYLNTVDNIFKRLFTFILIVLEVSKFHLKPFIIYLKNKKIIVSYEREKR